MSGVKHTPGPWVVDPHHTGDVQDAMGREIGSTYQAANLGEEWSITGDIPWDAETMAANARLIASAPDFFDHAKSLVEAWDARTTGAQQIITGKSDRELQKQAMDAIDGLRAAIARARGES